jgi:hypothetical protein
MRFIWAPILILLLLSCDKEDKLAEAKLEIISGDNQSGTAAYSLEHSLVLKANSSTLWKNGFMIRAKMKTGNGFVSSEDNESFRYIYSTEDGFFSMTWNLGCDFENQEVVFYLYHYKYGDAYDIDANYCTPLDSISFHAETTFPKGWVKMCGLDQWDAQNTRLSVVQGDSYLVNFKTLYVPDFTVIPSWKIYSEHLRYLVNQFTVSPSHKMFVGSEGGLFSFSDNHLEFLTDKISRSGVISILAEDSVLFCSYFLNQGLFRIRPGESDWTFLTIDGAENLELRRLQRHPNGNLYAVEDFEELWMSEDNGDTWSHFQDFNKYIWSDPFNLQIHPTGLFYLGTSDGMLRVISPNDLSVIEAHSHAGAVTNIYFTEDAVYYLADGKIWSSSNNWQALDLGFDKTINSFSIDAKNRLFIESSDGVYVFRE